MDPLTPTEVSHEVMEHMEVVNHLDKVVFQAVDELLIAPEKSWQPTDFLPDMCAEDALEQVRVLRERSGAIPGEVITSLVGNMITEEALPSYQTFFNLVDGVNTDHALVTDRGWVRWSRAWTAEENRHGDLLNKYLFLSGRVDMRSVELTIQRLINNGFDPKTDHCPYQTMIYTSFQERATRISHTNTGKLADKAGDTVLSRICKTIAGDEARHEKAYKSFMSKIFELDPNGAVLAFEKMMKKQIAMPAILMDSGNEDNMFVRFSAVTQKIGIYTAWDYASIIEHLVQLWKLESLTGLNAAASKAQAYLCKLADRYKSIAERIKAPEEVSLVWLSV